MFNVKIAITTVPERLNYTLSMVNKLKGEGYDVEIVLDADKNGLLWNWIQSMNDFDEEEYTHLLNLDDDLLLSKNFMESVMKAIEILPDEFMSFSDNRNCIQKSIDSGCSFIRTSGIRGNAMLYPASDVDKVLEFHRDNVLYSFEHDDWITAMYLRYNDRYVYVPIPCLVKHLPVKSTRPNVHYSGDKYFLGADVSWIEYHNGLEDFNVCDCDLKVKYGGLEPLGDAYKKFKGLGLIDKSWQNTHLDLMGITCFKEI